MLRDCEGIVKLTDSSVLRVNKLLVRSLELIVPWFDARICRADQDLDLLVEVPDFLVGWQLVAINRDRR